MTDFLVFNIEAATPTMIRSLDRHCKERVPDGSSAIDPDRSKLNKVLVGNDAGVLASLRDFYASGVKPPAKQSESPYLRFVVGASPSYFRPGAPDAVGTWRQDRLNAWKDAAIGQLKAEHGDDLVYAELQLDEDTPHIHAVIAPTYVKKPRKPGRKKRGETDKDFEDRKAKALDDDGQRTVGRASHPTLSQKGSFQQLRKRMAQAVESLGIEYGEDRSIDAPPGKSTRAWVKEQAAQIRVDQAKLAHDRAQIEHDRKAAAEKLVRVDVVITSVKALAAEIAAGTIYRESGKVVAQDLRTIGMAWPEITDAVESAADAGSALRAARADVEKERGKIAQMLGQLKAGLASVLDFIRRPEVSAFEQMEAARLAKRVTPLVDQAKEFIVPSAPPSEESVNDADWPSGP